MHPALIETSFQLELDKKDILNYRHCQYCLSERMFEEWVLTRLNQASKERICPFLYCLFSEYEREEFGLSMVAVKKWISLL